MEKKITLGKDLPEKIKEEFKIYPELLGQLLFYRDIKTQVEADKFLNPSYEKDTHDPFLIKGMGLAVEMVLKAVDSGQKILIYSDYDADGIPGAVILNDFFKKIGFENFIVHIPNRLKEGYGLKIKIIERLREEEKIDLIITVDSGITDVKAIKKAKDLGIDVIITDHHLINGELPPANVILDSKQEDDNYPDDMLCGTGVIFKLILALIEKGNFNLKKGWEKWLLDLVGLATVADMVPLRNENRVLAHYGLMVLRKSRRLGLQKLFRKAWVKQHQLVEEDISFMIAPRINAASRVSDPRIAFDLLSTQDEVKAGLLADELDKLNNKRKTLVATAVRKANKKIKEREVKDVIVIGDPEWNVGLSGLIASSLQGEYGRPCFVWGTDENGKYCGSCRAENIDLVELMNLVEKDVFEHTGGHKMAGGFGVNTEQIHFLEEKILNAYEEIKDRVVETEIFVDKKIDLDQINWENYKLIEKLAPFGMGNSKPLFLFEEVEIFGEKVFGKTANHLELVFKNSKNEKIKAIDFFSAYVNDKKSLLKIGQRINFLANIEKNNFNGANELRLRIAEIIK
ncbi:MAG: single-stranded-DNA-specific exonuclease RecJ [Candidatus Pacebacteria bacterium]|nr:single-stranded-DNA-specific exonuclease RecJ [Candidatus Paceibacterota bacterium]